jgi:hypothetical protein
MRKLLLLFCLIGSTTLFAQKKGKAGNEKIPDIAGTWFQDGDSSVACYIVQNKQTIVFLNGKETSNGYFRSSYEVIATDWNANAILSANEKTLSWGDRKWNKGTFSYPDISGVWYENGEAGKKITITQKGTKLVMNNGNTKLEGYFYTTNAIYSLANNNYGTYSPLTKTITWGSKKWMRNIKI